MTDDEKLERLADIFWEAARCFAGNTSELTLNEARQLLAVLGADPYGNGPEVAAQNFKDLARLLQAAVEAMKAGRI